MHLQLQAYIQTHLEDDGSDEAINTLSESLSRTERFAEDVCASVPQFLLPAADLNHSVPFSSVQTLKCGIILPALFIAGSASKNPELRLWAIRTMKFISTSAASGRMRAASLTAEMLETNPGMDFRFMYAKLGGYAFTS